VNGFLVLGLLGGGIYACQNQNIDSGVLVQAAFAETTVDSKSSALYVQAQDKLLNKKDYQGAIIESI